MTHTKIWLTLLLGISLTSCKKDELKDAPTNCIRVTDKIKEVVTVNGNYTFKFFIKYKTGMQADASIMQINEAQYNNVNIDALICDVQPIIDNTAIIPVLMDRPNMIKTF